MRQRVRLFALRACPVLTPTATVPAPARTASLVSSGPSRRGRRARRALRGRLPRPRAPPPAPAARRTLPLRRGQLRVRLAQQELKPLSARVLARPRFATPARLRARPVPARPALRARTPQADWSLRVHLAPLAISRSLSVRASVTFALQASIPLLVPSAAPAAQRTPTQRRVARLNARHAVHSPSKRLRAQLLAPP